MWSMPMYHPDCVFCQSNRTRLLLFEQVNLVCQQWAEHCICTFSLPVQMPHLAKVGVCWQAAHEGRTSYWILGSTSPPSPPNLPLGESGIRYNLRVSENFCDPQYQGQEIKWNYVTLPPYAGPTTKTAKSQLPSFSHFLHSEMLPFGIFSKIDWIRIPNWQIQPNPEWWKTSRGREHLGWQVLRLITFRVIRMGMIYIFVQIGHS